MRFDQPRYILYASVWIDARYSQAANRDPRHRADLGTAAVFQWDPDAADAGTGKSSESATFGNRGLDTSADRDWGILRVNDRQTIPDLLVAVTVIG